MKVYTGEEVAQILKVTLVTVKNYIKDGKLISANTRGDGEKGAIRISEENLKKFLNGGE
jgi:excisionase family DNA binding protein